MLLFVVFCCFRSLFYFVLGEGFKVQHGVAFTAGLEEFMLTRVDRAFVGCLQFDAEILLLSCCGFTNLSP